MKIENIRKENLPRERLINSGVESLSNYELIAILLRCGTSKHDVFEISHEVLNSVTNIGYLKDLTYNELVKIEGIKTSKACTLLASFELAKRCYSYHNNQIEYSSCQRVYELMKPILSLEKREVLYCLFLDSKCHLIEKREISSGTINSVVFSNQEILRRALKLSAISIILVHNHPSGDKKPSKNDIESTLILKKSLEVIGVLLLDHIIIANNGYTSMSESNII